MPSAMGASLAASLPSRMPKPRQTGRGLTALTAAAFQMRVLHHAVIKVCKPVLERLGIHDSYSCREGKGLHEAALRAQSFTLHVSVAVWVWYPTERHLSMA